MGSNKYRCLLQQSFQIENLTLVPIRLSDRYDIMKWRNEQIYHLRQNTPLIREDQDSYFENVVFKLFEQEQPSQILFSLLENDTCVGYGGLVHINWESRNAEISFIMDTVLETERFAELWGKYLYLIEQVAFGQLAFQKIFTYAFDLRPKLYDALVDMGYSREATLKNHCYFEGEFIDVVIHSKIQTEPYLRKMYRFDLEQTFKWASDEGIRRHFNNPKIVGYDEHQQWFLDKIQDENSDYLMFCLGLNKIGSIRLDRQQKEATISYLIDKAYQNKGFGTLILKKCVAYVLEHLPSISFLNATVKEENIASCRIFEKLGFEKVIKSNSLFFKKELRR